MSDVNEAATPFLKPTIPAQDTSGPSSFMPIAAPEFGQAFNPNSLVEPEEVARQRYLAAMIEAAPDKDYEAGRQRMAATVHSLYPELSFDEVYQNPFPVVAQLTGYDFRNGGEPVDVLTMLKDKMKGVADNFQRNLVAMDVGDLEWAKRNAGTDTQKMKLQGQIDAQKSRLQYWPFDKWGATGTKGGIIDQVLGVGDSALKFSTDFVAGITHDVGKPVVTAFNAQDIQQIGDVAKIVPNNKNGTGDPLSILTSPHIEVDTDGRPVTVQGRPLQAFLLWGIKNTPLVGTGYVRMAGSAYSEMIDAGVDPATASVLSDTVAKAGAAANLLTFGILGNVVAKGVSKAVAGDVLDNAVFNGVKKYLMNGQNLDTLAKAGMVRLETTQGGRLIKASAQTGINAVEMGLVNGGLTAASDIAFNAGVELTNGLIRAKGEEEARSQGITDEYKINAYVASNAQRLAEPFRDVVGGFVTSFTQSLAGMVALGGTVHLLGKDTAASMRNMTPEDGQAAIKSIQSERAIATGQPALPEAVAAFRAPDEKGNAPLVQSGVITSVDAPGSLRSGTGIRVSLEPVRPLEAPAIEPQAAIDAIRTSSKVSAVQAEAFTQAVNGAEAPGLNPELTNLARAVREGDTSNETLAVAQRYGIEPARPVVANVDVKLGKTATLNAEEMKNPVASVEAYRKQGFDSVKAGPELYVFKGENVLKTGEAPGPDLRVYDPANADIQIQQTKATVTSNGQSQEFPVTRTEGAVHVGGEVSQAVAPHLARKLADASEGQRIEADSPALRDAVERLNPDAPAIKEQIGRLETQVENARADGLPTRELEGQLQAVKDSLTTPTARWKEALPEFQTKPEFEASQAAIRAERSRLGESIPEQILKAAPNVSEAQAKTIGEFVDRLNSRTGDKVVRAILSDETLDANGAANQAERVIRLGKDANFDTVFEEVMHLAELTLSEKDLRTLIKELKLDTEADGLTLTRAGHEALVDGARLYVQQKENGSSVLNQIKTFLFDVIDAIQGKLSKNAMAAFDNLFGEDNTFTHDQSGKMGSNGGVGRGGRTGAEQGLAPDGGPEAGAVVDRAGLESGTPMADQTTPGAFPGELLQQKGISEHERLIQKALADGRFVPDRVLEDYLEKPWALDEWNKRHPESQRALEKDALTTATAEEFVARVTDPLYPADNIPEAIRGLTGEDLKTELADYWARTVKKDTASDFNETVKSFSPDEVTAFHRDALVLAAKREGALKTELGQARRKAEFNGRLEAEARVKIRGLEDALTSARAEAKDTASKTYQDRIKPLENALTDARAEHVLTLRHLADARRERATMEKLARGIMRPVGRKTIEVHHQAALKAIQDQIDPRFRKPSTLANREFEAALAKLVIDAKDSGTPVSKKFLDKARRAIALADKKSLDQFTLAELSDLAGVFKDLYDAGRLALEAKVSKRKAEEQAGIDDIMTRAEAPKKSRLGTGVVTMENIEKVQGTPADVIRRYSLDPHRQFDHLDGGHAKFDGPFYDLFVRGADKAEDARIRSKKAFQDEFESVIAKNGFLNALGHPDAHEFFTTVEVDGRKLYVQEAMDVYVKWKNDASKAALVGDGERTGNRYTQEFYDKVVAALTPGQKAVADWVLEYYNRPETKDAFFTFVEENLNYTPKNEENYTRIRHLGFFKERTDTNIRLEMAGRALGPMAVLPSGASIDRVKISEHHQTPLQLGLIDEVFESADFNARYMNFLDPIRKMEAAYSDRSVQELVQDKAGNEGMGFIRNYIDLLKNPNMGKNPDTIFRVMRAVKSNISKAYMGFNPKTVAMQIAAPLLYTSELENPLMLAVGIMEVNKGWNDTFRDVERLSPQLWDRLSHGTMRQILASTDDSYLKMLGDKSMTGIGVADTLFAAWGWQAVFREKSEKINPKTNTKYTEAEAAKLADEAMNRTQQPTFMKDKSELFGNNEALSWMTMFQGPLNKVWNILAYDLPRGSGGFRKAATLFGVVATGYVTWMVAAGKPAPTDDKEWTQLIAGQVLGAPVPIIGSTVNNMVYGYDKTGHFTPAEPVQELLDAGKVAIKAAKGEYSTEEAFQKFIDKTYGFYALANGIPLVEVRRAFTVVKDAMDGKGVQVQNLMGKEYGK